MLLGPQVACTESLLRLLEAQQVAALQAPCTVAWLLQVVSTDEGGSVADRQVEPPALCLAEKNCMRGFTI